MKLVENCFRCSVMMLKFNFGFILFLQIVKLLLGKENTSSSSSSENSFTPPKITNLTSLPSIKSEPKTSQQYFTDLFKSMFDLYAYDIDQIEATKTDQINIYNSTSDSKAKPYVTVSSLLSLNELFQFNNLRNMIKVILALNLNLAIVLVNILILCHLLLKQIGRVKSLKSYILSGQLIMNLCVLVFMLVLNTIFMLMVHRHHRIASSTFANLNKTLLDFFTMQLTRKQNFVDLKNFLLVDSRIKLTKTNSIVTQVNNNNNNNNNNNINPESETGSTLNNSFLYLNINIGLMIASSFLLLCYSFFLRTEDSNNTGQIEDEEKDDLLIDDDLLDSDEDGFNEKKEVLVAIEDLSPPRIQYKLFKQLKKRKLEYQLTKHVQCIVYSFFIVYLLGVWEMADVYQYCRMQNWAATNMNFLKPDNSQYAAFLASLDTLKGRLGERNDDASSSSLTQKRQPLLMDSLDELVNNNKNADGDGESNTSSSVNLINNYFNKFSNNFYQHVFYHQSSVEYKRDGLTSDRRLTATTRIRALFAVRTHSQTIGDLLIVLMVCIIIFNLDVVDWTLSESLEESETHEIIDL